MNDLPKGQNMNRTLYIVQKLFALCCALTIGSKLLLAQDTANRTLGDDKGYKIVEGDIIVPENFSDPQIQATWRQNRFWPNGTVPFQFNANVTLANRNAMLTAMAEWERVANVDFIIQTNQGDWVEIRDDTLNASAVGRAGGRQEIMIFNWNNRWIMCHELAHCLGYWHEQSRPDRDTYVRINWGNIIDDKDVRRNFDKYDDAGQYGPYDFDSLMHYRHCDFSVCPLPNCNCVIGDSSVYRPSITVLPPNETWQNRIGQRTHLSRLDTLTMSFLYAQAHWRFVDATPGFGIRNGTFLLPYFNFGAGLANSVLIPTGAVIWIQPGHYPDGGVYTKAMTLNAPLGGVIIGR